MSYVGMVLGPPDQLVDLARVFYEKHPNAIRDIKLFVLYHNFSDSLTDLFDNAFSGSADIAKRPFKDLYSDEGVAALIAVALDL